MLIGITGTNGAGKGEVVKYLVEDKGFVHFSTRSLLAEELGRRGIPVDRQTLIDMGNMLRQERGGGYIAEELCRRAVAIGGDRIIESIRSVGEVNRLREERGFYLWGVDADIWIRYQRIVARGSETDKVTYEEFVRSEAEERKSGNSDRQNLDVCLAIADVLIYNNGTIWQLQRSIEWSLRNQSEKNN